MSATPNRSSLWIVCEDRDFRSESPGIEGKRTWYEWWWRKSMNLSKPGFEKLGYSHWPSYEAQPRDCAATVSKLSKTQDKRETKSRDRGRDSRKRPQPRFSNASSTAIELSTAARRPPSSELHCKTEPIKNQHFEASHLPTCPGQAVLVRTAGASFMALAENDSSKQQVASTKYLVQGSSLTKRSYVQYVEDHPHPQQKTVHMP